MGRAPDELERLERLGVCYRLTRNCRNTRAIALATSFLSGITLTETLVTEGPDVLENWAHDLKGIQKCVTRTLHAWIESGLEPEQIVVLSPRVFDRSAVATIERKALPRPIIEIGQQSQSASIGFSTIAAFKGLEADAILLVDIDDLTHVDRLALLYAGASRAKSVLGIVMDESCRETYQGRVAELVGRLVERTVVSAP